MPRYHFATIEHNSARHGIALDLADISAARSMVVSYAGELLKEIDGEIYERDLDVRVTDDDGLVLYAIAVIATEAPIVRRKLAGETS